MEEKDGRKDTDEVERKMGEDGRSTCDGGKQAATLWSDGRTGGLAFVCFSSFINRLLTLLSESKTSASECGYFSLTNQRWR